MLNVLVPRFLPLIAVLLAMPAAAPAAEAPPGGLPDVSFAKGRAVVLPNSKGFTQFNQVLALPSGRVMVLGKVDGFNGLRTVMVGVDGVPDPAWNGADGMASHAALDVQLKELVAERFDGSLVMAQSKPGAPDLTVYVVDELRSRVSDSVAFEVLRAATLGTADGRSQAYGSVPLADGRRAFAVLSTNEDRRVMQFVPIDTATGRVDVAGTKSIEVDAAVVLGDRMRTDRDGVTIVGVERGPDRVQVTRFTSDAQGAPRIDFRSDQVRVPTFPIDEFRELFVRRTPDGTMLLAYGRTSASHPKNPPVSTLMGRVVVLPPATGATNAQVTGADIVVPTPDAGDHLRLRGITVTGQRVDVEWQTIASVLRRARLLVQTFGTDERLLAERRGEDGTGRATVSDARGRRIVLLDGGARSKFAVTRTCGTDPTCVGVDARNRLGTPRANRLTGTYLPERISGGGGNDVLDADLGADVVLGGTGNDAITAADGVRDVVDCGAGVDKATVDQLDVVSRCEQVTKLVVPPRPYW